MTQNNSVLIVGSGPTGMILAGQLTALGVSVRIIDKLSAPVTTSRAFTIHARTLELLGQMDLQGAFLNHSIKTYSMDYHFPQKEETPQLDFRALDSVYPYCLTINQTDTETILREHLINLGGVIEWETKLDSVNENEDGSLTVTLRNKSSDAQESVTVDWLIGCDGHYSTVRGQLNLPFDGSEYAGTMRMMDVQVAGFDYSDEAIHYFIAKDHMLLMNKLPGENHRVLISDKTEGVPPEEARAAFQETLDKHFAGNVQIDEPTWTTNFRISKRKSNSYRQGHIFLAGDSAHVNSPAGGQGMNVAMQDAFNLSWKLAMVIKGEAKEALLDTYEAERSPVASQMLEGTNYIHSIIMAHGKGMEERIARMRGGEWNRQAVNQVAGISYTYRTATASEDVPAITIGDRAPDGYLANEQRIYDLVASDGFTLFLFVDNKDAFAQLSAMVADINERFTALFTAVFITPESIALPENTNQVKDSGSFRERYPDAAVYLIRPDYHIAYIGANELQSHLEATLL